MSADGKTRYTALGLSICWGLLGVAAPAQEAEEPDLKFLEYLGSWEASDEDWIIFTEVDEIKKESKEERDDDPSPDGEKVAEANDEN
jgi:hypothetical protein